MFNMIPCDYCPKKFFNQFEFLAHLEEGHDSCTSVCIFCYARFAPGVMMRYLKDHFQNFCPKRINTVEGLPLFKMGFGYLYIPLSDDEIDYWLFVDGSKLFLDFENGKYTLVPFRWPIFHFSDEKVLNLIRWCTDPNCHVCENRFENHFNKIEEDDEEALIMQL